MIKYQKFESELLKVFENLAEESKIFENSLGIYVLIKSTGPHFQILPATEIRKTIGCATATSLCS